MFDYSIRNGASPQAGATVWSQTPLQPLAPGVLTPFSYSVLAESVSRGWYVYYDRLGFNPAPRSRLVCRHAGRAYLNLSLSARLDAEHAGVEPVALRVDGQPWPLCPVEKAGLIAGFRLGRARKKIDDVLETLEQESVTISEMAHGWYRKTLELRWTQAEILQIMEEIERVGRDTVMAYFAARHNLELLYNRLIRATTDARPFPTNLLPINDALCDVDALVEAEIARAVVGLSQSAAEEPATIQWLKAGRYGDWQATLTGKTGDGLRAFLEQYGHRCLGEGEMAARRWLDEPDAILAAVLACVEHLPKLPGKVASGNPTQKLLEQVAGPERGKAQEMVRKVRKLEQIQSRTLHAVAYVWAGARRWAAAAAREALADGRILEAQDIFFYDLEEIKEMMTGELNISDLDKIRATCAQRKAEHAACQGRFPGEVLFGEGDNALEAWPTHKGLPGAPGHADGPLLRLAGQKSNGDTGAILGAEAFDVGWSLTLPVAEGFVAATGTPIDPFVAAARGWHRPVVVGLGERYAALVEGAETSVDGNAITVQQ